MNKDAITFLYQFLSADFAPSKFHTPTTCIILLTIRAQNSFIWKNIVRREEYEYVETEHNRTRFIVVCR